MTSTSATTEERFGAALAVLADLPTAVSGFRGLSVASLLRINELHAAASRALGAAGALIAELADEGTVDEITGEVLTPTQPWMRPGSGNEPGMPATNSISPG